MGNKAYSNAKETCKHDYKKKNGKSSGQNQRNTKNNFSDKSKFSKPEIPNDPSWYAGDGILLKNVASIPFSTVQGLPLGDADRLTLKEDLSGWDTAPFYMPGVAAVEYAHSLGCSHYATDGANVASRLLYTFIRHANSGSTNYEAPDLFMVICAWHSARAFLEEGKRAYGVAMNYLSRNRYFADTIIAACGFDPEDLRRNLPVLRTALNIYTSKLNAIKVPGDMPVGKRWVQLASEYYTDGKSTKAQVYVPRCISFLKFNGYGSPTGTSLDPIEWRNQHTVQEYINQLSALIDPLVEEEDVGIMSGDIMKAYGDGVSTLTLMPDDYYALPSESDEMLMQIHNACGVDYIYTQHRIYQQDGIIHETYTENGSTRPLSSLYCEFSEYDSGINLAHVPMLIDMYKDDVTPEDVIVATRLSTAACWEHNATNFGLHNTGTEIFSGINVFMCPVYEDFATVNANTFVTGGPVAIDIGSYHNTSVTLCAMAALTTFDWHPIMVPVYTSVLGPNDIANGIIGYIGDLENYTQIDPKVISRMNEVAILNEFAVSSRTKI